MNIYFFVGGLSKGGVERTVCNLANYFCKKGHHVHIITMSDDKSSYELDNRIHRCILLENKERRGFFINTLIRLHRFWKLLISCKNADVYVGMMPIPSIMLLSFRWLTSAKIVNAERNFPQTYSKGIKALLKVLSPISNLWIFQTQEERVWYGHRLKDKYVRVIPNAINPDFIRPVYIGERRKTIVSAGRMSVQKNQELLVRAFATISKDIPDYKLVIYGEGEKRGTLTTFSEELGIKDRVQLPGYTTNIGEKIKDASLFVLPSDFEGMPNALMEAMALGLPCVSTDCDGGGARFLIENEKNGLLVPKGDVEVLASAMKRMLADRNFAEQCGKEAHKICERLAPDKVYGQWEEFIKQVVDFNE